MARSNTLIPDTEGKTIQLVDRYALTGGMETVAITDVGDKRIYHYAQQTGNITNDNAQRRNDNPDWDKKSEFRQAASVPMNVWLLWESTGITLDQKKLRKALMRHKEEYMVVDKNLI